jgi:hypothetical protein
VCEVREKRLILLAVEILALHLGDDLDLLDVALLLNLLEEAFEANVGLALFLVEEFDVLELRVHCASQVGRQRPGSGSPSDQADIGLVNQRESYYNSGVLHVFVVLTRLEVGEHCVAASRERHDLGSTINKRSAVDFLFVDLSEGPPNALHERLIHRLVVVLEVNPSAESVNNFLPVLAVGHDNASAFFVIVGDS